VAANRPLPLAEGLNPAWAAAYRNRGETVVAPLLGGSKLALSEGDWNTIKDRMTAFGDLQGAKPDTAVATLSPPRLTRNAAGTLRQDITALVGPGRGR